MRTCSKTSNGFWDYLKLILVSPALLPLRYIKFITSREKAKASVTDRQWSWQRSICDHCNECENHGYDFVARGLQHCYWSCITKKAGYPLSLFTFRKNPSHAVTHDDCTCRRMLLIAMKNVSSIWQNFLATLSTVAIEVLATGSSCNRWTKHSLSCFKDIEWKTVPLLQA